MRHGEGQPIPLEMMLSADPELAMVWADMAAWAEAHPCECEAIYECEEQGDD